MSRHPNALPHSSNTMEFGKALDEFTEKDVPGAVRSVRDRASRVALEVAVFATPVSSRAVRGAMRGAWVVTSKGKRAGRWNKKNTDAGGGATVAKGYAVIDGTEDAFARITIANKAPHFHFINNGTRRGVQDHRIIERAFQAAAAEYPESA
jgi:hypothetical protein